MIIDKPTENIEEFYSQQGDRPLVYPVSTEPGYKSVEEFYSEQGDRPLVYPESTEPGYKSSEHYYNEGIIHSIGPNINGKKPAELIESGQLTAEILKPEDKKVVYDDIMMGVTNDKDMLSKKIDLLISDEELINRIVSNQYKLAVEEMQKEKMGYVDYSPTNRNFQFLATLKILMEKEYDLDTLQFQDGSHNISIEKLVANYRKKCNEYGARTIEDPSWFKSGKAPDGYDMRKVNNPWLFSGTIITDLYNQNENKFIKEYEAYASTKLPSDNKLSFEEYMYYSYAINVSSPIKSTAEIKNSMPESEDAIQRFKNARAEQMQNDQIIREEQLDAVITKIQQSEMISQTTNSETLQNTTGGSTK